LPMSDWCRACRCVGLEGRTQVRPCSGDRDSSRNGPSSAKVRRQLPRCGSQSKDPRPQEAAQRWWPCPVACKARQHHAKGAAGHHHPANRSGDFLLVHAMTLPALGGQVLAAPTVASVASVAVATGEFGYARPSPCNGHPRRTGTNSASTVVLFKIGPASAKLVASKTSNPAARSRSAFAERETAFSSTTKTTNFSATSGAEAPRG
jgi:hypothetical protein